ncbi:hypothetical protein NSQ82_07615 [Caldifermentibacillus hisashii]|uniref:hypothetical protein n=1 Tax=Caldifermentibacillus hisashii TaxID=996558 RepID=UPI0031B67EE4
MQFAVENPMVHWKEEEPKVVGYCEGCGEKIYEGDDVYDYDGGMIHQDSSCCMDYVANMSRCIVAGEN